MRRNYYYIYIYERSFVSHESSRESSEITVDIHVCNINVCNYMYTRERQSKQVVQYITKAKVYIYNYMYNIQQVYEWQWQENAWKFLN